MNYGTVQRTLNICHYFLKVISTNTQVQDGALTLNLSKFSLSSLKAPVHYPLQVVISWKITKFCGYSWHLPQFSIEFVSRMLCSTATSFWSLITSWQCIMRISHSSSLQLILSNDFILIFTWRGEVSCSTILDDLHQTLVQNLAESFLSGLM